MPEREYEVWSTYKITGIAHVRANSTTEAIAKALDISAADPVQFDFTEPWGETRMQARRVVSPPGQSAGAA